MEPSELQATLRLVAGLLVPCVALLCCFNGLLLLRRRRPPAWPPRRRRRPPAQPPTPPRRVLAGGPALGLGAATATAARTQRCLCGRGQPRVPPAPDLAAAAASSWASSSDLERRPVPVPPNSPAGSWAAGAAADGGAPDGTFGRQHTTSMQRKVPGSRPAFPTHLRPLPFEYGSSIRRGDKGTQLSSANLTASQGPGLDSDFGASAGVSLRILSSDSEESPTVPLLHPQQSGRFEWDYYDPSYEKSTPLQRHLPCICSKQYWL